MKVFENVSFIFVIILVSIKKDESVIFGHPVVRQTIDFQIFLCNEALSFPQQQERYPVESFEDFGKVRIKGTKT